MENKHWNESEQPGLVVSTKLYFQDLFVGAKRMGRADFWWGMLGTTVFFGVLLGLLTWVMTLLPISDYYWSAVVGVALAISLGYYLIAIFNAAIRRLHDMNLKAWWMLLLIFTGLGLLVLVVMLTFPTREDGNKFNREVALP